MAAVDPCLQRVEGKVVVRVAVFGKDAIPNREAHVLADGVDLGADKRGLALRVRRGDAVGLQDRPRGLPASGARKLAALASTQQGWRVPSPGMLRRWRIPEATERRGSRRSLLRWCREDRIAAGDPRRRLKKSGQ
jgi:hypothetical protein